MVLDKFHPLRPYFRVQRELMHRNSWRVACVSAALIIWCSHHTISSPSLHCLTYSLSHLAKCANNVTSTSISRDRLAVSSYDNFLGAKMGILNEKKALSKDWEQFSILKTFITYIKLSKNEIKNFVSYTL